MGLLQKKLKPVVPSSVHDDGSDYSVEYSFAEEYKGPPLSYSIPEVHPFKLDQIPVAPIASSPSHHLSVPVIQPFRKTNASLSVIESSNSHVNLEVHDHDDKEHTGFHDENGMNPISTNSDSTESGSRSGLTTRSVSSKMFSCIEENDNDDPTSPRHVKRPSVVTFVELESNETMVDEDFVDSEGGSRCSSAIDVRPRAVRAGKKGTCYRCLKGNRLTEREVCIVCSAKYCRSCVLKAMGSMPEGRKCVTCIGYMIDENKRKSLGKFSRMLKHLLSDFQVKQIMHDEMFCEANQVPAEHVHVNGEPLDWDQLMKLLSCPNPPKGLKPGFYWYDKASGFWGKVKNKHFFVFISLI